MAELTVEIEKVQNTRDDILTSYLVRSNNKFVGYVWKSRGFSYRGVQGWNRGIRLQDFHPLEWHYGKFLGHRERDSYGRSSRADAVNALITFASESGE